MTRKPNLSKEAKIQLEDAEWLGYQYLVLKKNGKQIANEVGCSVDTIYDRMRKYGIKARNNTELNTGRPGPMLGKHHSLETRRKQSNVHKGKIRTEEHCKNLSIALTGKHPTDETRLKLSESHKGKYPTDETRRKLSESHRGDKHPFYGKHHTKETCTKISNALKGDKSPRYGKLPSKGYNRGKGGYFIKNNGSKIWLRSTYEIRVANMLDILGLDWEYESTCFDLNKICTYRPDFYIKDIDVWWEVKGWMDDATRKKMNLFFECYPNINLRVLWNADINELESLHKNSDLYSIINIGKNNLKCNSTGNYSYNSSSSEKDVDGTLSEAEDLLASLGGE